MEFVKKYLVLLCGFSLFLGGFVSTSIIIPIILGTYIFYCLQNPEKNYISKALNCLKVFVLAMLFSLLLNLLIPLAAIEDTRILSYLDRVAESLPYAISRLITSTVIALPTAFIVPIFFKTKISDREDVLDM